MHMFCENYSLSVSPERISSYTVSVYYICSMCTTLFNETCANKTAALPSASSPGRRGPPLPMTINRCPYGTALFKTVASGAENKGFRFELRLVCFCDTRPTIDIVTRTINPYGTYVCDTTTHV